MGIYDRHYYGSDDLEPLRIGWSAHSIVTKIIVANVVVQLIVFIAGRNLALHEYLTLRPDDLGHPLQWYRFVTYGFTHSPASIQHIFFNMLSLFFLGRAVEEKYGRHEFIRIYMAAIVACGLAWAILHGIKQDNTELLGASGATTTIAMLFVFSFPHAILRIWGVLPVKAWVVGILIVGGNLIGNSSYVAYDVHLIGAALAAVYFFSKWNLGHAVHLLSKGLRTLPFLRSGLKLYKPSDEPEVPSKLQQEADRILDKLHRDGRESLTSREERFLEDYSRRLRKHRSRSHRT